MEWKLIALVSVGVILVGAGCLGSPEDVDDAPSAQNESSDSTVDNDPLAPPAADAGASKASDGSENDWPVHVLDRPGVREPDDLTQPRFAEPTTLLSTPPYWGGGEPSVWAHWNGTTLVAFPGCEEVYLDREAQGTCEQDQVFVSTDAGEEWEHLNTREGDRFAREGPVASGDIDVVLDGGGDVFVASLFNSSDSALEEARDVPVWRSSDEGESWSFLGGASPPEDIVDRQWLASGADDHVVATWRNSEGVAARHSLDGGDTWSPPTVALSNRTSDGAPVVAPDGRTVLIPATRGLDGAEEAVVLAISRDRGQTWQTVDTGARIPETTPRQMLPSTLAFPAVDVSQDGTIAVVWSQPTPGPTQSAATGAQVRLVASGDGGQTWSQPVTVSQRASAVFPWIVGGGGDRFAVNYYASDQPVDPELAGIWDVQTAVVDGPTDEPGVAYGLVDEGVHEGPICSLGVFCPPGTRSMLDFFENDVLPDGRVIVAYTADPVEEGRQAQIRVGIQDSGTPIFTLE